MTFDFAGSPVQVEIPEGFVPTDVVVIVRSQAMDEPGVGYLSMGVTEHTGGILQHGMLSLVNEGQYVMPEDDDD